MRTEDSNNTHKKFDKIQQNDIRWCFATCDCIKNDWWSLTNFRSSHLDVFEKQLF